MSRRSDTAIRSDVWSWLFVAIATLCIVSTDTDTVYVTAPLAVGLLATLMFFWALWCRRLAAVPWFELGAVYVAAVTLYMAYPLIGFLALHQTYTPLNDGRLRAMQPDAAEVGRAGWLYGAHLVAFCGSYIVVRGRLLISERPLRLPGPNALVAIASVYVAIEVFALFVGLFFNMSASTYAEGYLVARRLPLIVAQMLNHLGGVKFALALMLMAALFGQYHKYKFVILAWLLVVGAITTVRLGSRTDVVLLILAAAMMYHAVVRPLPPRAVVMMAAVGLVGFLVLGVLRSAQAPTSSSFNPFIYASEFENLFGNVVHLNRVKETVGDLPLAFYLADFAALVPQQLAPFAKIDRADWYVSTFFPVYWAGGGGLAFGAIAEAVLTGGWIAAMISGAALGFCFAKIHRLYARHSDRFWIFVMYVWISTLSYQSFRNSSFALLVLFVYRFVPAFVLVNILGQAFKRMARRTNASAAAAAINV